jgi:hypothetical protein
MPVATFLPAPTGLLAVDTAVATWLRVVVFLVFEGAVVLTRFFEAAAARVDLIIVVLEDDTVLVLAVRSS